MPQEKQPLLYFHFVSFTGYPQPKFRWLKNDEPITDFSPEPFYKIVATKLDDEGSYRCIASNKVGSIISEEIKVTVACKYIS